MGIADTLRALRMINKASKFVKENEDKVIQIKSFIEKIKDAIIILENKKALVQEYINKAHEILSKLKGFV